MLGIGNDSRSREPDTTTTGNSRREQVSRNGGLFSGVSGSDRIEAERVPVPANDIRKYWDLYQTFPFVRASVNQFRDDIVADGRRAEADNDASKTYLENWLDTAGTLNGERNQDILGILRDIPVQLLVRGTVLLEHTPAESDSDKTAGVQFIHPATVTPYRASDTNLLLRPDDTQYDGAKLTADGEAAAYVQYDGDNSEERRLTLDQVTRMTLDADTNEVFGTSRVAPVADRIEAVLSKLQDNDRAVETNAWKNWFVGFGHETVQNDDGSETIIEWDDDDMDEFMDDLESVEPGDIEGHDGTIEIDGVGGEVADIIDQLRYETHYILTAMPSPTYAVGFEKDINQFVVDGQQQRYEKRVTHFQRRISRELRPLARSVLNQGNHNDAGARILLEPPEDDNPALNMSDAEIERLLKYGQLVKEVSGGNPRTLLPDETIRRQILRVDGVDENGGWEPDDVDISNFDIDSMNDETFDRLLESRDGDGGARNGVGASNE